jgi:hypothetical protein
MANDSSENQEANDQSNEKPYHWIRHIEILSYFSFGRAHGGMLLVA